MPEVPGKRCAKCEQYVPLTWFYRRRKGRDAGKTIEYCIPCSRALAAVQARRVAAATRQRVDAHLAGRSTWTQPVTLTLDDVLEAQTLAVMARSRGIASRFGGRMDA